MGLLYKRGSAFLLNGYIDADLGGDLDDRRSTSCYVFLCNFSRYFMVQQEARFVVSYYNGGRVTATEAEYKGSTLATQECVCLRLLVKDIYRPTHKPTILFYDNQNAIKLASNSVCHGRTKRIEIEHHFIRAIVLDGTIRTLLVRSKKNVHFHKDTLERTVRIASS